MRETRHIISWGAGTQSSTLLLMAKHGLIDPMPDAAIFADTGDDPQSVYDWLAYIRSLNFPFPIHVARRPFGLGESTLRQARNGDDVMIGTAATPPFFVQGADGIAPLTRGCTKTWKADVLHRAARKLFPDADEYVQWIGISTDEASRMKPSRVKRFTNRYPLAMELRMSRQDCLAWMKREGYPRPPRSACYFCPYHSNDEWRRLRDDEPEDWQRAIEFERAITHGLRGTRAKRLFLHRSCVPLDEVDLETREDRGQMGLWGEECEGMCGV